MSGISDLHMGRHCLSGPPDSCNPDAGQVNRRAPASIDPSHADCRVRGLWL